MKENCGRRWMAFFLAFLLAAGSVSFAPAAEGAVTEDAVPGVPADPVAFDITKKFLAFVADGTYTFKMNGVQDCAGYVNRAIEKSGHGPLPNSHAWQQGCCTDDWVAAMKKAGGDGACLSIDGAEYTIHETTDRNKAKLFRYMSVPGSIVIGAGHASVSLGAFSPDLTTDQLAEWLKEAYGLQGSLKGKNRQGHAKLQYKSTSYKTTTNRVTVDDRTVSIWRVSASSTDDGLFGTTKYGARRSDIRHDYWILTPPQPGTLQVKAVSADAAATKGNGNYSLEGAVYRVYSTKADAKAGKNSVAKLTTDVRGRTQDTELPAGTYYVKQTKTSAGYRLCGKNYPCENADEKGIHKVVIASEKTCTLTCRMEPKRAGLRIRLTSADPAITKGSDCYSLEGAVYRVYRTKADAKAGKNSVAKLTTGEKGKSDRAELPLGVYYVKETKAAPGFKAKQTIQKVDLRGGKARTLACSAAPLTSRTKLSVTVASSKKGARLSGAEFTVKFYEGQYNRNSLPDRADRTWVIKASRKTVDGKTVYQAALDEKHRVSGDDFYRNAGGTVILPLGTITVQETKAAPGHTLKDGYLTAEGTAKKYSSFYLTNIRKKDGAAELKGSGALTCVNQPDGAGSR